MTADSIAHPCPICGLYTLWRHLCKVLCANCPYRMSCEDLA